MPRRPVEPDRIRAWLDEWIAADEIQRTEYLSEHSHSAMPQDYGLHDFLKDVDKIVAAAEKSAKSAKRTKSDYDLIRHRHVPLTDAVTSWKLS
jgi:hypothetical protein